MLPDINLINKKGIGVTWSFKDKIINIPFESFGYAIYSDKYKLVVIMNYMEIESLLDMKAYSLNGEIKSNISPYEKKPITYSYLATNKRSKSGIVVIGTYKDDHSYDWQFEVDLDEFKISDCIARAY